MHRRDLLRGLLGLPVLPRLGHVQEGSWVPLFNGTDLRGWETFLGKPHQSVDIAGARRNGVGEYLEPFGVDIDPRGVFSVVTFNGAPAIRISGDAPASPGVEWCSASQ